MRASCTLCMRQQLACNSTSPIPVFPITRRYGLPELFALCEGEPSTRVVDMPPKYVAFSRCRRTLAVHVAARAAVQMTRPTFFGPVRLALACLRSSSAPYSHSSQHHGCLLAHASSTLTQSSAPSALMLATALTLQGPPSPSPACSSSRNLHLVLVLTLQGSAA